jgi:hypothetical protein
MNGVISIGFFLSALVERLVHSNPVVLALLRTGR